jgi:DNA-directed RNA polymerase specialized sigma24 family protein
VATFPDGLSTISWFEWDASLINQCKERAWKFHIVTPARLDLSDDEIIEGLKRGDPAAQVEYFRRQFQARLSWIQNKNAYRNNYHDAEEITDWALSDILLAAPYYEARNDAGFGTYAHTIFGRTPPDYYGRLDKFRFHIASRYPFPKCNPFLEDCHNQRTIPLVSYDAFHYNPDADQDPLRGHADAVGDSQDEDLIDTQYEIDRLGGRDNWAPSGPTPFYRLSQRYFIRTAPELVWLMAKLRAQPTLMAIISSLGPGLAEVIGKRWYIEGGEVKKHTLEEVGRILGLSKSGVWDRLERAKSALLRKLLAHPYYRGLVIERPEPTQYEEQEKPTQQERRELARLVKQTRFDEHFRDHDTQGTRDGEFYTRLKKMTVEQLKRYAAAMETDRHRIHVYCESRNIVNQAKKITPKLEKWRFRGTKVSRGERKKRHLEPFKGPPESLAVTDNRVTDLSGWINANTYLAGKRSPLWLLANADWYTPESRPEKAPDRRTDLATFKAQRAQCIERANRDEEQTTRVFLGRLLINTLSKIYYERKVKDETEALAVQNSDSRGRAAAAGTCGEGQSLAVVGELSHHGGTAGTANGDSGNGKGTKQETRGTRVTDAVNIQDRGRSEGNE